MMHNTVLSIREIMEHVALFLQFLGKAEFRGRWRKPTFVYTIVRMYADRVRSPSVRGYEYSASHALGVSSCRDAAWLLVELMCTKQGRVNFAQASRKS